MVRLIAQFSSSDEAINALRTLKARGVQAGSLGTSIILTLTREDGCMPNTREFHAANAGEVRAFAHWALEAGIELSLGGHGCALGGDYKAPLSLSREEVGDLAREYGPTRFPVMHTVHLAATRNGQLADLREQIGKAVTEIVGKEVYDFQSVGDLVSEIVRATELARTRHGQELFVKDQRIADLEQQLAAANQRAAELAHQRNQATRRLRRVRKAAKV